MQMFQIYSNILLILKNYTIWKNVKTNVMRNYFFVFLNEFSFLQKSMYGLQISYFYLDGPFVADPSKMKLNLGILNKFSFLN